MKKLFVLVMLISLMIPTVALANGGGITHVVSADLHYSDTGWGGWSCPAGMVVVNAGVQGNIYPVGESIVWKPGATTAGGVSYPNTPFGYTYTPPEEGYIVQNGGRAQTLQIWLDCAPPHDYSVVRRIRNNCGRWEIRAILKDYGQKIGVEILATGMWTDPYAYETVYQDIDYAPSYGVTFPDGSTATLTTPPQIDEKSKCHDFTINVIERSDCDGYYRKIKLRDDGVWIKLLYRDIGSWTDLYTIEMLPGLTVPISDVYGDDVVFDDLYEPKECLVVLDHEFEIIGEADGCDGWFFTTSSSDGGVAVPQGPTIGKWLDLYTLESASITYDVTWPDGYAETFSASVNEPERCLKTKNFSTELINDCFGFEMVFSISEGGTLVLDEGVALSGIWLDPYKLEAALVSGKIVWLDETEDPFSYAVSEPAECFVCKVTPLYRMITLLDYDAPDWYYGTGSRNGSCWVVMTGEAEDAPGVAVFRQADICSVCAHPDFIYEADKVLYDADVTINCNGEISYPDPLWKPEWFRSDYKELDCHRQPSCINK